MSGTGGTCAIYSCRNYKRQKESKSFYRMPKNKDLLQKWVVACKRKDLDELLQIKEPVYFYKRYVVCSDHFEIECFRNKHLFSQGLIPTAIPTLLLCNAPIELKRKNRDEIVCQERPQKEITISIATETMQEVVDTTPTNVIFNETSTSYSRNKSIEIENKLLREENSKLKLKLEVYKKALKSKSYLIRKHQKLSRKLQEELAQCRKYKKSAVLRKLDD